MKKVKTANSKLSFEKAKQLLSSPTEDYFLDAHRDPNMERLENSNFLSESYVVCALRQAPRGKTFRIAYPIGTVTKSISLKLIREKIVEHKLISYESWHCHPSHVFCNPQNAYFQERANKIQSSSFTAEDKKFLALELQHFMCLVQHV